MPTVHFNPSHRVIKISFVNFPNFNFILTFHPAIAIGNWTAAL